MKNWKAVCLASVVLVACIVCVALKPAGMKMYHVVEVQRKQNTGPDLEKALNDAAKDGWELVQIEIEENKVTALIMVK
jgi:hypothetical protein